MKWIKEYNIFNETIRYDINKLNRVMEDFNKLYNPLGIWIDTYSDSEQIMGFEICFNFSWDKNKYTNIISGMLAKQHYASSFPVYDKGAYKGNYTRKLIISFCQHINGSHNSQISYINDGLRTNKVYREVFSKQKESNLLNILIEYLGKLYEDLSDEIYVIDFNVDNKYYIDAYWLRLVIIKYNQINKVTPFGCDSIYKLIYEEIQKSPEKAYRFFNSIKGTEAYEEFKKIGDPDKIATATDMGEMGF